MKGETERNKWWEGRKGDEGERIYKGKRGEGQKGAAGAQREQTGTKCSASAGCSTRRLGPQENATHSVRRVVGLNSPESPW